MAIQAQAGVTQLGNVLGLNGAQGSGQALQTLTNTPGYQFAQQQGQGGVNSAAQSGGTGASGNQQLALQQHGQGLATQNYNTYVNQLQPYLQQSNAAAGGINQTYQGLGQNLAANSQGLGQGLAGQYGNLANLGWQTQTGIGNANANADLSAYNASANALGAIGGFLGSSAKAGATTAGAGGAGTAIGQGLGSVFSAAFLAEGGDAEAGRPYVVGDQPGYAAKLRRYLAQSTASPDHDGGLVDSLYSDAPRALVGEGSQHHDQSQWFDSLVAKLQLDADLANVRRRHMAPSDWDLGKFDDRRPPRPTYEDSARGLQGFQSGGDAAVGRPAIVGITILGRRLG